MKRLLLCFLLVTAVHFAEAQYYKTGDTTTTTNTKKKIDPSRIIIGGSLGLAFGDYTNIDVSPLVGYRISQLFAAGININAQYGSERFTAPYSNTTTQRDHYSILGGGVWGRVYPLDFIFVHVQPEYNFVSMKSTYYNS